MKIATAFRNFTSRSEVVVVVSSVHNSAVAINWVYKWLVITLARFYLATSAGNVGSNGTSFGPGPVDSASAAGWMPPHAPTSSCNSSLVPTS